MSIDLPDPEILSRAIKAWGRELGFADVRIADVDLAHAEDGLRAWLAAGHHGEMDYMASHGMKRARPDELVPGTVRVISARMDYLPAATPQLLERHRAGRGFDWAAAPLVRFNDKDDIQQRILDQHGVTSAPPTHEVPDGGGFVTAVRSGLGWGALLTRQLAPLLESGELVRLGSRDRVDVPLYWQRWRLPSAHLDRLSAAVRRESAHGGTHPSRGSRALQVAPRS